MAETTRKTQLQISTIIPQNSATDIHHNPIPASPFSEPPSARHAFLISGASFCLHRGRQKILSSGSQESARADSLAGGRANGRTGERANGRTGGRGRGDKVCVCVWGGRRYCIVNRPRRTFRHHRYPGRLVHPTADPVVYSRLHFRAGSFEARS